MGAWSKKVGDAVKKDEVLVEIETDKVAVEVSSPADGVLAEITAGEGDTVTAGAVLGKVTEGGAAAPAKEAAKDAPKAEKAEAKTEAKPAKSGGKTETVDLTTPVMGESVAE